MTEQIDKIFEIFKNSEGSIRPHFILTGQSGSGKTYTIKHLAAKNKMNFLEINAATLTKEGYSGCSLSKALVPLTKYPNELVVCFVDEWDKLFLSGNDNSSGINDITVGVQNEFLTLLESKKALVFGDYGKYPSVDVSKVLFIFAGAFNGVPMDIENLREVGVKTEFLGRVNLIYHTPPVTKERVYKALESSLLLEKYCNLFKKSIKTEVKQIKKKMEASEDNPIGFRMISSVIHKHFIEG